MLGTLVVNGLIIKKIVTHNFLFQNRIPCYFSRLWYCFKFYWAAFILMVFQRVVYERSKGDNFFLELIKRLEILAVFS